MLSRIAESLFWIGRYVERADDTARILDIHLQLLLEDPWAEEDPACRTLLEVMDRAEPDPEVPVGRETVLTTLAFDRTDPSAIAGAIGAARENARRAREVVSTELWECLNTTWNQLPLDVRPTRVHDYFSWVRERAAVVAGITDSSTSRDATWQFMVLGRSLERADMTARLLATRALAGDSGPSWTALLRSCGAHEAYLRTYRGSAADEDAAGFLLLDRLFPRSIVYSLSRAERSLTDLEPTEVRGGVAGDARRALGQVRSSLEFRPVPEILESLPEEMEKVQRACATASDAIRSRYFPSGSFVSWVEEAL